ncbi:MAG: protein kinase [Rhodobacterales bacterium]|nr:protein kinase [Rhodobacterales bacterium]
MALEMLGAHPSPGDTIGPYLIEALIGSGGMATVFRARDPSGAPTAIKVLNPARLPAEEVKRFTREYRTLSQMEHRHIVTVYESGIHQGYPWIAMEFVDGTDLGSVISHWKANPPTDLWERVESIFRGLCQALQYVHERGMVHRDVKPTNVLVSQGGEAKLSDFGVVTGDSGGAGYTQLTMAGRLVGTVAFMAPESITSEEVDRRTDLYSLGALLYMMCTFHRPIEADSVAGYLARHLTEVPRPASDLNPEVPPVLERIAARLMQKDPSLRYPTAAAAIAALDHGDEPESHPLRGRDDLLEQWIKRLNLLGDGDGGVVALVGPTGSGRSEFLRHCLNAVHSRSWPVATRAEDVDILNQEAKGKPRIIALEDLDGIEGNVLRHVTRTLRQQVALEAEPLLLVFTVDNVEGHLATLMSGEGTGVECAIFELAPLGAPAIVSILRDRGVTGPTTSLLGRRLHRDYSGRPGPILSQLDAMVEANWFEQTPKGLSNLRPLEDLRHADLPVPEHLRQRIETVLDTVAPAAIELMTALALLDRPATSALLTRCVSLDHDAQAILDDLCRRGLLNRTLDSREMLQFSHPCAARVTRSRIAAPTLQERHSAIADALSVRRRRQSALEIAEHRRDAGEDARALPLFLQAAKAAVRKGKTQQVLSITAAAEDIREHAEQDLDEATALRLHRWLSVLRGEAFLARGEWEDAIVPLGIAVTASRKERDDTALGRALGSLGRAHYRAGRFKIAEPLLEGGLTHAPDDAPTRASATRALADIRLRAGDLDASERLWEQALQLAMQLHSRDGEARARRGLAHLRCIQGRLQSTGDLLDQAEELLAPDGDVRVRAGILTRCVEIETCAGRYGAALRRCEALVDLARQRDMAERLPDAYALLAEALCALGNEGEANDAAMQALVYAKAQGRSSWDAQLRAARCLADLRRWDALAKALPEPEDLPKRLVDDPAAQLAALRARLYSQTDPARSIDLALWALHRPPPLLAIRAARIAIDVAQALAASGQIETARSAVKRGLKSLQGPGSDGLRLELLLSMQRARPDERVTAAIGQIATRIAQNLALRFATKFLQRDGVQEALSG